MLEAVLAVLKAIFAVSEAILDRLRDLSGASWAVLWATLKGWFLSCRRLSVARHGEHANIIESCNATK